MRPTHYTTKPMNFRCRHLDAGILTECICKTAIKISGLEDIPAKTLGSGSTGIYMSETLLVVNEKETVSFPISPEALTGATGMEDGSFLPFPIPDHAVDAVFATMVLHHMNQPFETIREIKRILKPGGRIVLTDIEKHDFDFLKKEQYDRWQGFYFSDVRQWLSTAGFSNIIVGPVAKEKYLPSSEQNTTAYITIFVATGTASHNA